jgi:4,5-dihydroxyphthalate decarboxylase
MRDNADKSRRPKEKIMRAKETGASRREFIKTAAVAAGAAGALSACGKATPGSEESSDQRPQGLPITVAGYPFDRVQALVDGRAPIEGCNLKFQKASIGDLNTHVFSGPQTIEVTEIGLHPYMLAYANDGFRGYSLMPVFPLRTFRHKSVFIRTDRGIEHPEDLSGKVIATPGYSSTSLTWIRGIFKDEYGVKPEDVEWMVSSLTSDASSGKASKQENVFPDGLNIRQGPAGVDESELLVSGEVDALFHAVEPQAYVEGNPIVDRLFPDCRRVERAYFAKTGIFPIMHVVAVRDDLIDENPWILEAVFNAYSRAKKMNDEYLRKLGWAMVSLPWVGQELEETRELMGDNYWPYGIEPNRTTLETLFRYSYEQGLSSRELTVEELFHPATLGFSE